VTLVEHDFLFHKSSCESISRDEREISGWDRLALENPLAFHWQIIVGMTVPRERAVRPRAASSNAHSGGRLMVFIHMYSTIGTRGIQGAILGHAKMRTKNDLTIGDEMLAKFASLPTAAKECAARGGGEDWRVHRCEN